MVARWGWLGANLIVLPSPGMLSACGRRGAASAGFVRAQVPGATGRSKDRVPVLVLWMPMDRAGSSSGLAPEPGLAEEVQGVISSDEWDL